MSALRFTPRRRRAQLFGLRPGQLVAAELGLGAALAGAALLPHLPWAGVSLGVVAAALGGGALLRWRGRWCFEAVVLRWRLRRRIRDRAVRGSRLRTPAGEGPLHQPVGEPRLAALRALEPRLTVLRALEPRLTVLTFPFRGSSLGVGRDRAGWFAVVEVRDSPAPDVRIPLDELAEFLERGSGVPLSAVQVVVRAVPVPAPPDQDGPAAASYRELAGDLVSEGDHVTCLGTDVWVVARLDADRATEVAAARGGGEEGVGRAFAAVVERLVHLLDRAGTPGRALDADGVLDVLTRCCAPGSPVPGGVEGWTGWVSGGLEHVCYSVRSWPRLRPGSRRLDRLLRVPAAAVSLALTFRPAGCGAAADGARSGSPAGSVPDPRDIHGGVAPGGAGPAAVEVQALLHLVVDGGAARTAGHFLSGVVRRAGFAVDRLDGLHGPAVYAAAPTGAEAR